MTSESLTVTFGQTTTYTVQSQYDAANRRTGITYPDGTVVARQYTARDQLAQIDYNSSMVATFAYDSASRRTSRTLGDTPGTQTAWVYGRQDNLPTAINSGVAGASFSYTYDANKNKLTEGISSPMANFGFNSTAYDPADRLTAWNRTDGNLDQAWNLSLVGNWATFTQNQVKQTRSHTAVHEIAAIDSNPIAHDPAGNLTRNAGDTLDRYTWDFDNRLASADIDQDGTAECEYQFDARGQRVSKTVPDGEGSVTTVFVYLGNQVVSEYAADALPASPERKFVYATYIDEPVVMIDRTAMGTVAAGTDELLFYHCNSLYSLAALTDASAAVVERYAYSAYGKPIFLDAAANLLDPQASTVSNPYLFTGRRLDPETGLYYYRARMYDAELGRFVSRDPIGQNAGSRNVYQYVRSFAVGSVDPLGLSDAPWFEVLPPDVRFPPVHIDPPSIPGLLLPAFPFPRYRGGHPLQFPTTVCSKFKERYETEKERYKKGQEAPAVKDPKSWNSRKVWEDPAVKELMRCNVNVFCGNCPGKSGAMLYWEGPGKHAQLCLDKGNTNHRTLVWVESLLLHEAVHFGQALGRENCGCMSKPFPGTPPPFPENYGGRTCDGCMNDERPAYQRQAESIYPPHLRGAAEWYEAFIKLGLYESCGHLCPELEGSPLPKLPFPW
ncbi:MAG: RHS repeat-associated core domain-containing protein [Patescibacteria group bacterium]|nr:RHS repeat-associated core domain-containing protein [Patescibacteria group bacterium]